MDYLVIKQNIFGEKFPYWKIFFFTECFTELHCPHKQNRFPMINEFGQKQDGNLFEKLEEMRSK